MLVDLMGKIKPSVGGKKYATCGVDENTGVGEVFCMASKDLSVQFLDVWKRRRGKFVTLYGHTTTIRSDQDKVLIFGDFARE